jgi:hypothetical protein
MAAIPPLPRSFNRRDLETCGFVGWRTWGQLRASDFSAIPQESAAYVVYRPSGAKPRFLDTNPGFHWKKRDPTLAHDVLTGKWVVDSSVVYIGKANDARERLKKYARFGAGENAAHWGGRCIWQLADSGELLVAWHAISWEESAREYEVRLLAQFAELHGGMRPFANLTG